MDEGGAVQIPGKKGLRGVLFDFDGVIGNTMGDNFLAWQKAFVHYGKNITEGDYYPLEGMNPRDIAQRISNKYQVPSQAYDEIVRLKEDYYLKHHCFSIFPKVLELVNSLSSEGILLGMVTGSSPQRLKMVLPDEFISKFRGIVTAEGTGRGKPCPDPYIKGLELLGLKAEECLAIENAPLGIQSAHNAGLYCLAVMSTLRREKLSEADYIVERIADIPNAQRLKEIFRRHKSAHRLKQ